MDGHRSPEKIPTLVRRVRTPQTDSQIAKIPTEGLRTTRFSSVMVIGERKKLYRDRGPMAIFGMVRLRPPKSMLWELGGQIRANKEGCDTDAM